jgi:predicted transcriptional regulator
MPAGRPLKFKSVKDLQKQIDLYFEDTPKEEWTITGLALALDTSRKVLCEYEDDRKEYSNAIKKAKLKVENGYEIDLKRHGRSGTIFALKNFDWKDKSETDITTQGEKLNQPILVKFLEDEQSNTNNNRDTE